ncbi:signal peptidase I [Metasolibacillus meyeri]|uniref:Signal peptidase I n=1 Tax=Metasolibacillus meyeri TaxID=1071052 RepID=A0AAW9NU84_9BACL|nr:signal peptidase I [Metasolibacillus meyeri]MEC1178576.1 signal peptidase I [Metasolibacillus meyeri]
MEKSEVVSWIKTIVFAVILAVGIRVFLFTPVNVEGASMMPTFEDEEKVIVNIIGPTLLDYKRFDVIVFKAPNDENFIKRIIGLPGDRIEYRDDELFINGEKFDEPYLTSNREALVDSGNLTGNFTLQDALGEEVVPEGHYFVLGDNRRKSWDSRDIRVGFVAQEKILGTVPVVVWPLPNARIIKE